MEPFEFKKSTPIAEVGVHYVHDCTGADSDSGVVPAPVNGDAELDPALDPELDPELDPTCFLYVSIHRSRYKKGESGDHSFASAGMSISSVATAGLLERFSGVEQLCRPSPPPRGVSPSKICRHTSNCKFKWPFFNTKSSFSRGTSPFFLHFQYKIRKISAFTLKFVP